MRDKGGGGLPVGTSVLPGCAQLLVNAGPVICPAAHSTWGGGGDLIKKQTNANHLGGGGVRPSKVTREVYQYLHWC